MTSQNDQNEKDKQTRAVGFRDDLTKGETSFVPEFILLTVVLLRGTIVNRTKYC